jgi:hypothetical protein
MIAKLLRLRAIPETLPPAPEPGVAPVRHYPRIILYNPSFGQSLPGEEFPFWMIPGRLRPPNIPEWKLFCERRQDLTEEDMLDDDPFARALRPSLRDPLRLTLLAFRRDLYPREIDPITDPTHLDLMLRRRDVGPQDVLRMSWGFRSSLLGAVPVQALGTHVQALTRQAVELLKQRPDLRPHQLSDMLEGMRRNAEPGKVGELPGMFMQAVGQMDGRSGAASGVQAAASISAPAAPAAAAPASTGTAASRN